MEVTLKGKPTELEGKQVVVGEKAPEFKLNNLEDKEISLSALKGQPVVLSIVPDINTSVCHIQTKRFNQEAANLEGVHLMTISSNTKEQQANWCAAEGVGMEMLHDPEKVFGKAYGLYIPEMDFLARTIIVIDAEGIVRYQEIVPEVAEEPNYDAALDFVKSL